MAIVKGKPVKPALLTAALALMVAAPAMARHDRDGYHDNRGHYDNGYHGHGHDRSDRYDDRHDYRGYGPARHYVQYSQPVYGRPIIYGNPYRAAPVYVRPVYGRPAYVRQVYAPADYGYGQGYYQPAGNDYYSDNRYNQGYRPSPAGYYGANRYDPCRTNGTGAIVGAIAGGVIGNQVAGRYDRGLGTVLGAGLGAVTGTAIQRGQRCRY